MTTAGVTSLQLLARLREYGRQQGQRPAYLVGGEAVMTYGELSARVDSLAVWLRSELPAGSVVMLSAANQLGFPVAFFGILAAGCTVFPVSIEAADCDLVRAAEATGARGVIGDKRAVQALAGRLPVALDLDAAIANSGGTGRLPGAMCQPPPYGFRPHPSPPPEYQGRESIPPFPGTPGEGQGGGPRLRSASDTQAGSGQCSDATLPDLLLLSSGTTATPKIVRRRGLSLDHAASAMVDAIGFTNRDRVLMTVPLTHSYGLEHGLLAPVWAGSSVALCRGLDVPLMQEFLSGGATIFPGVPSTFELLARGGLGELAMPNLRRAYSAGGPLPRAVFDAFAARFGIHITQLYGASEIGSVTFEAGGEHPKGVGRPMHGVSIRILDVNDASQTLPPGAQGQIAIAAQSMFSGYIDGPAELVDGHFPTGDLGHLDERGRLFITGRLKLLIDVGGLKVNPLEVEAVLSEHPAVGMCVVTAVRQSQTIFRLKAIVTPRQAGGEVPIDELRTLARNRLAAWKVPRLFEVRPSLPLNSMGKIARHLLEET